MDVDLDGGGGGMGQQQSQGGASQQHTRETGEKSGGSLAGGRGATAVWPLGDAEGVLV